MNNKESKQKETFPTSEGDEWFNRNIELSIENDKIVQFAYPVEVW